MNSHFSALTVAAIVPAFNEAETVAEVVSVLRSSRLIQEVVVVSDGSTDDTVEQARSAGATVIELVENGGKAEAVRVGVSACTAPVLLFVDADVRGFTKEHIETLVRPVTSGVMGMVVGVRDWGLFGGWIAHSLPLVSGMRALDRHLFDAIPKALLRGYQLEMALNVFAAARRMPVQRTLLPGLKVRRKTEKVGHWRSLPQYLRMWKTVLLGYLRVRWYVLTNPHP